LRDLSPFKPSKQFELSQILGTQIVDKVDDPFAQGDPAIANSTLLDEAMDKVVEGDLNEDTRSQ
jgi:hypothetical protein